MIRTVAILVLLGALAAAAYVLFPAAQPPMLVQNAVARPVPDDPGHFSVTFSLSNPGGPDRLISAHSDSATVAIVRLDADNGTPIPAGSEPAFSLDGVYLALSDFDVAPREGDLVPIELALEQAGPLAFKARVETVAPTMDHGMMQVDGVTHDHMGQAAPTPALTVQVASDGEGWQVSLQTENFTFFRPEGADMAPEKPGGRARASLSRWSQGEPDVHGHTADRGLVARYLHNQRRVEHEHAPPRHGGRYTGRRPARVRGQMTGRLRA